MERVLQLPTLYFAARFLSCVSISGLPFKRRMPSPPAAPDPSPVLAAEPEEEPPQAMRQTAIAAANTTANSLFLIISSFLCKMHI